MKGTIINQVKYTEYQTGDKEPTLEEAQNHIGGFIEMFELKNGGCLLFDEEALISISSFTDLIVVLIREEN